MKKLVLFMFIFFGIYHTIDYYSQTYDRSLTLSLGIPLNESVSVSLEHTKPYMLEGLLGDKFWSEGVYGRSVTVGLEFNW